MNTHKPHKPFIKRIKPAGWLLLAVTLLLVVSGCGLLARPLTSQPTPYTGAADTPGLATMSQPAATLTPVVPAATPQGWTVKTDSFGKEYLAPPPEDEKAIRAAFEAVLACDTLEDRPDAEALKYDWQAALDAAAKVATSEVIAYWQPKSDTDIPRIILAHLGPENPVRCQNDHATCTVEQAKMGSTGAILYSATACASINKKDVCMIRPTQAGWDSASYALLTATLKKQDGIWRVTEWHIEKLPTPPSP